MPSAAKRLTAATEEWRQMQLHLELAQATAATDVVEYSRDKEQKAEQEARDARSWHDLLRSGVSLAATLSVPSGEKTGRGVSSCTQRRLLEMAAIRGELQLDESTFATRVVRLVFGVLQAHGAAGRSNLRGYVPLGRSVVTTGIPGCLRRLLESARSEPSGFSWWEKKALEMCRSDPLRSAAAIRQFEGGFRSSPLYNVGAELQREQQLAQKVAT